MSDNIPPIEIQAEIIKKVPDVRSLLRFRSVSKPWKSIIDSSEFIADYHTRHPNYRLLVRYADNGYSNDLKYVSIVDDDNNSCFPQHKFPLTIPESVRLINKPMLVGSSHGLFCFYDIDCEYRRKDVGLNTAVVWNPSTRKSVDIAVPNVLGRPYDSAIGFGVCPHSRHFKLVKVTYIGGPTYISDLNFDPKNMSYIPYQVEVFTGGGWRNPLCMNNLPRISIAFEPKERVQPDQVEIDGVIYWLAYDWSPNDDTGAERHYRELIMSFDPTSEEFTEIYLPDDKHYNDYYDVFISKLKESLVVLECNMVDQLVYDVWKMEHGISKTFTKLYTISMPEASIELDRVLGFRNSGEPIVVGYIDSEGCFELDSEEHSQQIAIFVYEPDSKILNNIGISGELVSFFASSYIETLLLVDH